MASLKKEAEIILPNFNKTRTGTSSIIRKNKITELFKNVRELKIRKEEAENALKELGSGKIASKDQENESFISVAELKKQVSHQKEELEKHKKISHELKIEKKMLEEKLQIIWNAENTDSLLKLLQSQLHESEQQLAAKSSEIEEKQASHLAEISKLLEKNCALKEKIKANEAKFCKKLKQVTDERDFIMKNARLSE